MQHSEFTGFVMDALLNDPDLPNLSDDAMIVAEPALRYGIRDLNGNRHQRFARSSARPSC